MSCLRFWLLKTKTFTSVIFLLWSNFILVQNLLNLSLKISETYQYDNPSGRLGFTDKVRSTNDGTEPRPVEFTFSIGFKVICVPRKIVTVSRPPPHRPPKRPVRTRSQNYLSVTGGPGCSVTVHWFHSLGSPLPRWIHRVPVFTGQEDGNNWGPLRYERKLFSQDKEERQTRK